MKIREGLWTKIGLFLFGVPCGFLFYVVSLNLALSVIIGLFIGMIAVLMFKYLEGDFDKLKVFQYKYQRHPFDQFNVFSIMAENKEEADKMAVNELKKLVKNGVTTMSVFYPVIERKK